MKGQLINDPEFVQGQIDALHALVLALANELDPDTFRDAALTRLQAQRDVLIGSPSGEARIRAIDAAMTWVEQVTA